MNQPETKSESECGIDRTIIPDTESFRYTVEHTRSYPYGLAEQEDFDWSHNKNPKFLCWYDHHAIELGKPIYSYPVTYDARMKKWNVNGMFCSPNCMFSYIRTRRGIPNDCINLMSLMIKLVYAWTDVVEPSPCDSLLSLGILSIDEFRDMPNKNMMCKLSLPVSCPFMFQPLNIISHPSQNNPNIDIMKKLRSVYAETQDNPVEEEPIEIDIQPKPSRKPKVKAKRRKAQDPNSKAEV